MEQLQEIDYAKITIDELIEIFSKKIIGHNRPLFRDFSSEGFFRARIINKVEDKDLDKAECIWYPDWSKIAPDKYSYNRCSNKGENFFYASNSLEAVVREMTLTDGDKLLIGEFHTNNRSIKIPSQFAGIEDLKNTYEFKSILSEYNYASKADIDFEKLIATFYKKRIPSGSEFLYKPSIAFSKILLKNEAIKCLIYPSVKSDSRLVNYGIKPDFVDENMNCQQAYIFNIEIRNSCIVMIPEKYAGAEIDRKIAPRNWIFNWNNNTREQIAEGLIKYCL
jgi:hypothetical protein